MQCLSVQDGGNVRSQSVYALPVKQLDLSTVLLSDLHTETWNSAVVGCAAVALHAILNIA